MYILLVFQNELHRENLETYNCTCWIQRMSVDCYDGYGNQGCNGGLMDSAFQYIEDKGGLETESEYPYTAEGGDCTFDKSKVVATCIGFTDVTSGSETDLQSSVATVGPVSVAIDASQQSFHLYESGVYDECSSVNYYLIVKFYIFYKYFLFSTILGVLAF